MSDNDMDCAIAFTAYMGALAAVSIIGFAYGYPDAAFVWVLPLLTGFHCGDDE